MALQDWELQQQLSTLLPLDDGELKQILGYANSLPRSEAGEYLHDLLGDSPEALRFVGSFSERRAEVNGDVAKHAMEDSKSPPTESANLLSSNDRSRIDGKDVPSDDVKTGAFIDTMGANQSTAGSSGQPPAYAPPPMPPPTSGSSRAAARRHTNPVIEVGKFGGTRRSPCSKFGFPFSRLRELNMRQLEYLGRSSNSMLTPNSGRRQWCEPEMRYVPAALIMIPTGTQLTRRQQEMQQLLQNLQYSYGIYNSDIEPEHDTDYPCSCPIHQYQVSKWRRYGVQDMWSKAVMYPGRFIFSRRVSSGSAYVFLVGEKAYTDNKYNYGGPIFTRNPYQMRVVSPYGYNQWTWGMPSRPKASWHARSIHQTISLNNNLNRESQANIDAKEPKYSIWDDGALERAMSNIAIGDKKRSFAEASDTKQQGEIASNEKRQSLAPSTTGHTAEGSKTSGFAKFRKSIGIKSSDERAVVKAEKTVEKGNSLRDQILAEENGRWPDEQWRQVVANYQAKVGMTGKIAELRARCPIQYLHLLRAGYFEPIPVAWANQASNPLKFSIEAAAGWRGITPAWRGYEVSDSLR